MWQPTWQRLYNLIYEARFGVSVHPSFPDIHVINDLFTMPPWGILATWFQMPAWTKHSSLVRRDFWLLGWEISQQQKATTFDTHGTSSKKNISTIRIAIFYLFQNPTHTYIKQKCTHIVMDKISGDSPLDRPVSPVGSFTNKQWAMHPVVSPFHCPPSQAAPDRTMWLFRIIVLHIYTWTNICCYMHVFCMEMMRSFCLR